MKLQAKVAIVTVASRGIGTAIAIGFAKEEQVFRESGCIDGPLNFDQSVQILIRTQ